MGLHRVDLRLDGAPVRALRLERHPSETPVRVVLRVLAACLAGDEELVASRGVCEGDRAPLSTPPDGRGRVRLRIELGLPPLATLERAASGAERLLLVTDRPRDVVRHRYRRRAARTDDVEVALVGHAAALELAGRLERAMHWDVETTARGLTVSDGAGRVEIPLERSRLGEL